MPDKYIISKYSGRRVYLDKDGRPDFEGAYGSPRRGSSSSSSRRRDEPYRPRDSRGYSSLPIRVREERHYPPEPAPARLHRLPPPPIGIHSRTATHQEPIYSARRDRHEEGFRRAEPVDVGRNERTKEAHMEDISDCIRRARKDESGYDWSVQTGYWRKLLERYEALSTADPEFREKERDIVAKTFYTMKKGIEERKEQGIKPSQGGFDDCLDYAKYVLDKMPRRVGGIQDLFEDGGPSRTR